MLKSASLYKNAKESGGTTYSYSNVGEYFTGIKDSITERRFVEEVSGSEKIFLICLRIGLVILQRGRN